MVSEPTQPSCQKHRVKKAAVRSHDAKVRITLGSVAQIAAEQRARELERAQKTEGVGYHLTEIPKGVLGESSKVREELAEFDDAMQQGNRIMALLELADAYGAIELIAEKLGSSMEELMIMSAATRRAFESRGRK